MTIDLLSDYPSVFSACNALAPNLGIGAQTLRRCSQNQSLDIFLPHRHLCFMASLSGVSPTWSRRVERHILWPMGGALGQGAARRIASRC